VECRTGRGGDSGGDGMTHEQELYLASLHESGHAVAAIRLGGVVDLVMMYDSESEDHCPTCYGGVDDGAFKFEANLVFDLAAMATEVIHFGTTWTKTIHLTCGKESWLGSKDWRYASRVTDLIARDDKHRKQATCYYQQLSVRLMRENWKYITAVAERLRLNDDELRGVDIEPLLGGMQREQLVVPADMAMTANVRQREVDKVKKIGDRVFYKTFGLGTVVRDLCGAYVVEFDSGAVNDKGYRYALHTDSLAHVRVPKGTRDDAFAAAIGSAQ
jgi:hypothetical protein